jgi:acetyl-CoA acyltransferase
MREAVIVSSVRTAVGKAPKGTLRQVRPDDMAAAAIEGALARVPAIEPGMVEDVILGCAMPEGEQGMNVARISALVAGIPHTAAAMTINRFCSSGLQAIALAARAVENGECDVAVAGGTESMSLVPMGGQRYSPNPTLVDTHPEVYLGMGLTAERLGKKYDIDREQTDAFALASHHKAVAAIDAGRFEDEIVPLKVTPPSGNGAAPEPITFDTDEGPRRDTSMDALAKLRPAFAAEGIVTAGNASQMSDGAVVVSAKKAKELGLSPIARLVSFAVAGVPPEIMGIGPVEAIPKALARAGLKLQDMELIELNEAFATQALAVIKAAELDPDKINVNGGAVALGHPLGCTGAKLSTQMLYELKRRDARYGLVTMCVGGGMGAAGVFERL